MLKQDAVRGWSVPTLLFLWMLSKWISGWEDAMATSAMPWGVAVGSDSKIEMQLWVPMGCLCLPSVRTMLKGEIYSTRFALSMCAQQTRTGFRTDAGGADRSRRTRLTRCNSRQARCKNRAKQKRLGGPWRFREQHQWQHARPGLGTDRHGNQGQEPVSVVLGFTGELVWAA
jgi:hypothetical protein